MNINLTLKNIPVYGVETWWRAFWYPNPPKPNNPAEVMTDFHRSDETSGQLSNITTPNGTLVVAVWSKVIDQGEYNWIPNKTYEHGLSLTKENTDVAIDFLAKPSFNWTPIVLLAGGVVLAVLLFTKKR